VPVFAANNTYYVLVYLGSTLVFRATATIAQSRAASYAVVLSLNNPAVANVVGFRTQAGRLARFGNVALRAGVQLYDSRPRLQQQHTDRHARTAGV
jgi:hypothetical protein